MENIRKEKRRLGAKKKKKPPATQYKVCSMIALGVIKTVWLLQTFYRGSTAQLVKK